MSMDYFVELSKRVQAHEPDLSKVDEVITRYHLLLTSGKKEDKRAADELRARWGKQALRVTIPEPTGTVWQMVAKPTLDVSILPTCSFALQFTFTLAKPYLSKDDNAFYILDNPVVRDKVFRLPMVRPSSWKGNLYAALWQLGRDKKDDAQMQRLFGEVRGEEAGEEKGSAGRLFFYPTFFTQTSLEIINPHDRQRRVGKNPILFESVPRDARGTFTLLYVPFDCVGEDQQETRRQAIDDLKLVAQGIQAMFRTYGFSAKRTSGYGTALDAIKGVLRTKAGEKPLTRLSKLAEEVANVQL